MENNSYNENDLKIIKFDIEKLTRHLENQEKINDNNTAILLNIQSALLGNDFNEKKELFLLLMTLTNVLKRLKKNKTNTKYTLINLSG